ncbi:FAD-linked sulfhydryl oxidase ALR [Zancudomyces culisetae]|uniref:Sulfhydryl oxidase n=1 Tax=Zancudomyces culisetae TaxID=1213189 RepID=A0A1R1PTB0_ZANCU|nr:FAD-linked sulfhydryl oxidase ALR [Zancudomyces culisetae]|eukprot:OMH84187.1 FAD-linked sulfhydryl oxidase ALR [Zancudomyces culisetae]
MDKFFNDIPKIPATHSEKSGASSVENDPNPKSSSIPGTKKKPCRVCDDFKFWTNEKKHDSETKTPTKVKRFSTAATAITSAATVAQMTVDGDSNKSGSNSNSNSSSGKFGSGKDTPSFISSIVGFLTIARYNSKKYAEEMNNKPSNPTLVQPQSSGGVSFVPIEYFDSPPDSTVLGSSSWTFLHTMAAYYPEAPTIQQQKEMTTFINLFAKFYPCSTCSQHLVAELNDPSKEKPQVKNNRDLSLWMCKLHNGVNRRLGKPEFDCASALRRWKDGFDDE